MPTNTPIHILWHWITLGPYHFARMAAIARQPGVRLTVVESTSRDDHDWRRESSSEQFQLVTLANEPLSRDTHRRVSRAYLGSLCDAVPDLVVESGYAEIHSFHNLLRYRGLHPEVRTLLWSETTQWDHKRVPVLERLKKLIVGEFNGALVAGGPHAEYMKRLGLEQESIQIVGNCVDNDFFSREVAKVRGTPKENSTKGRPYFLYVGRFIPEKNLPFLVRSYARYREAAGNDAIDLVLVGSGPEEAPLRSLVEGAKVSGMAFVGTRQVEELPKFYASACCFVLPSACEPWGLVVNEAMASGLPVLASKACGCAQDLVVPGKTGYVFSPDAESELAELMQRIATHHQERTEMGRAAQEQVKSLHVDLYAGRVVQHVQKIVNQPARSGGGGFRTALLRHLTGAMVPFF